MSLFSNADLARRIGLALAAAAVIAALAGLAFFVASGATLHGSWFPHNLVGSLVLGAAFAAMVRREPHNAAVWTVGWAMVIQAFGLALVIGVSEYGLVQTLTAEQLRGDYTYGQLPTWLAWLVASQEVTWIPGVLPLVTLALLLFPDGRPPSRRWRPVVWIAVAGPSVLTIAMAWLSYPRPGVVVGDVPDTPALVGLVAVIALGAILTIAAILASLASLVVRYRRASGVARRQIRWIAVGGALFGLSLCAFVVAFYDLELAERLVWLLTLITTPVLLAAYAVAILRYRLYDIDVVISRSLVAGCLAAFIAATYTAVVVGVGQLVGARGEANLALQVAATAIVAVAFQPLRLRLRRWADRLVYGNRATPYEVLAQFSRQVSSTGDEESLQRVADVLAAGTGAAPAIVWLRVGDRLRAAAVSDRSDPPPPAHVDGDDLVELDAALVAPVRHDGELLGAITIDKPRSDPPTPQHEELVRRLASGLALVLRNARLTAELREHLDELEASRQRVVHAQDETRRKIERDLHDGAQRHLLEFKARIGLAGTKAAEAGAERTAALLDQLTAEADETVAALRDLAQGIYPPLLEAEGLGPALSAQAGKGVLPATVHASGLSRYGRDVEAAVYFCILEALQNATKYAEATSAHIRLEERDGRLRFEVSDDGSGFDPSANGHGTGLRGMADRLDTVGGRLEIDSVPGQGTRIRGEIPVTVERRALESAGAGA